MNPKSTAILSILLIGGIFTLLLFYHQSSLPKSAAEDPVKAKYVAQELTTQLEEEISSVAHGLEMLAVTSFWQSTSSEEWIHWLNSQHAIYQAAGLSSLGIHARQTNILSFQTSSLPGKLFELEQPLKRVYRSNKKVILLQMFKDQPAIITIVPIKTLDKKVIGSLIGIKQLNKQNLKDYQTKFDVPVAIINKGKLISSSLDFEPDIKNHRLIEVKWPEEIKSSLWTPYLLIKMPSLLPLEYFYLILGAALTLLLIFIVIKQIKHSEKSIGQLNQALNIDLPINEQINRLARLQAALKDPHIVESIESIKVRLEQLIEQKKFLSLEVRRLKDSEQQLKTTASWLSAERDSAVAAPRLKSEFLSRMGDEITVPMKSVVSMLRLLSEYSLEEEARELLNIAKRSTRALVDNLNNILDFSKLDAKMLKLHPLKFNVRQLIDDLNSELSHFANEKGLSLQASCDADIPAEIKADVSRIKQVIRNLLGNAIRFTKVGEVSLYADVIIRNEKQLLRFTIKDTGVGIPEEAQKDLFESLQQSSKLSNSSFAGRLRLIVSKNLVDLMGGEIGVFSDPGQGSQFWFTVAIEEEE